MLLLYKFRFEWDPVKNTLYTDFLFPVNSSTYSKFNGIQFFHAKKNNTNSIDRCTIENEEKKNNTERNISLILSKKANAKCIH